MRTTLYTLVLLLIGSTALAQTIEKSQAEMVYDVVPSTTPCQYCSEVIFVRADTSEYRWDGDSWEKWDSGVIYSIVQDSILVGTKLGVEFSRDTLAGGSGAGAATDSLTIANIAAQEVPDYAKFPENGVRVYIGGPGQSNQEGRGDVLDLILAGIPIIGQDSVYIAEYRAGKFNQLIKGNDLNELTEVGWEFGLIKHFPAAHPGEKVYVIKYAIDGSSATIWEPGQPHRIVQDNYLIIPFLNKLIAEGKVPFVTFFTLQGEADVAQTVATQKSRYLNLIESYREIVPDAPFVLGGIKDSLGNNPNLAYQQIADSLDNVKFVPTTDLTTFDGSHWPWEALDSISLRFVRAADSLGFGAPIYKPIKRRQLDPYNDFVSYDFEDTDSVQLYVSLWNGDDSERVNISGDNYLTINTSPTWNFEENYILGDGIWFKEIPETARDIDFKTVVRTSDASEVLVFVFRTNVDNVLSQYDAYEVQYLGTGWRVLVRNNDSPVETTSISGSALAENVDTYLRISIQGHTIKVLTSSDDVTYTEVVSHTVGAANRIESGRVVYQANTNETALDDVEIFYSGGTSLAAAGGGGSTTLTAGDGISLSGDAGSGYTVTQQSTNNFTTSEGTIDLADGEDVYAFIGGTRALTLPNPGTPRCITIINAATGGGDLTINYPNGFRIFNGGTPSSIDLERQQFAYLCYTPTTNQWQGDIGLPRPLQDVLDIGNTVGATGIDFQNTFTAFNVPLPSQGHQVANKDYVDNSVASVSFGTGTDGRMAVFDTDTLTNGPFEVVGSTSRFTQQTSVQLPTGATAFEGSPPDGSIRYDSVTHEFRLRINGSYYKAAPLIEEDFVIDFPSTAANDSNQSIFAMIGAEVGDAVSVVPPIGAVAQGSYFAYVSAVDTITLRFINDNTGTYDPSSGTFTIKVIK
ncbi:MAG: sialate O-acetylesterase [Bacteroidota bacterium]